MLAILGILLFLLPLNSPAQPVQEKIDIQIVNVYVSALDAQGKFVTDLQREDFELMEDGRKQSISHFTNFALDPSGKLGQKDVPLTLAFVMDTSSSMQERISGKEKIDIVRTAALRLITELREEDQVMLVSFSEYPEEITNLTSDRKKFSQDLLFLDIEGGNTALLDSVYFALEKIKHSWGRKIIVICSDGEDTTSTLRFDEVLSNVIASDVTILSFGTMALSSSAIRGRYILEKLASASGGYAFFPTNMKSLEVAIEQLRQGMRSQYSLGYRPDLLPLGGSWHKILVTCRKAGLKIRHREGYYAAEK